MELSDGDIMTDDKWLSQHSGSFEHNALSPWVRIAFCFSTIPLDLGAYDEMSWFLMWNVSYNAFKTFELKLAALSETMTSGTPHLHIRDSYITLATSSALCVGNANASVQWLKLSIANKMFLFLFLVVGKPLKKSICQRLKMGST